jgi:2-hydroxy-3-keto-5-methylthiopentenyl-1-phosphate phosphatase
MSVTAGWVVFSDFDGTLSTRDLVEGLVRHFRPEAAAPVVEAIKGGQISLKAGVAALYDLLPTTGRRRYQEWVHQAGRLRPGVDHLLDRLRVWRVPFYVVSNGLDSFIQPVLGDRIQDRQLYCNRAVWSKSRIQVEWPFPCSPTVCFAECGLCKPTVMRWLTPPGQRTVLIGDGVTDLEAARRADLVFARDGLAHALEARGIRYQPFADLYDVARYLQAFWEVS